MQFAREKTVIYYSLYYKIVYIISLFYKYVVLLFIIILDGILIRRDLGSMVKLVYLSVTLTVRPWLVASGRRP